MGRSILLTSLVATLFLNACATTAQRDLERMSTQADSVRAAEAQCWSRVNAFDDSRVLDARLIRDVNDPERLRKLSLDGPATAPEKIALIEHSRRGANCRKVQIEGWSIVHPIIAIALAQSYMRLDELELQLLKDQVTVGEFNQRALRSRIESQQSWERAFAQVNAQLQAAHTAEVSHRQTALSQTLQLWAIQQQALARQQSAMTSQAQTVPTPTYTRCVVSGSVVRCTTE